MEVGLSGRKNGKIRCGEWEDKSGRIEGMKVLAKGLREWERRNGRIREGELRDWERKGWEIEREEMNGRGGIERSRVKESGNYGERIES